jgi:hypothetical protein
VNRYGITKNGMIFGEFDTKMNLSGLPTMFALVWRRRPPSFRYALEEMKMPQRISAASRVRWLWLANERYTNPVFEEHLHHFPVVVSDMGELIEHLCSEKYPKEIRKFFISRI